MKIGLFSMNAGVMTTRRALIRFAKAAESAGFESLWVGDHVVLPDPPTSYYPEEPHRRRLDPLIALTFMAGVTERVKLGTGVIILPQRNPLVLAKQLASLDELSDGRLIFGFGVGHLVPEFEALGIPFNQRGAMSDEYLAAMRSVWRDKNPVYQGEFVSFANIQAHPQRDINVVVGGHSQAACRRAVRSGRGWYGFSLTPDTAADCIKQLHIAAQEVDRPDELGPLEINVTPKGPVDQKMLAQFETLGVHRLILLPPADTNEAEVDSFISQVQNRLLS